MWRNPNHPQPEAPSAPRETGRRLATFPRNQGKEELRLGLDNFEGHDYVSLRLWARGDDGSWWPTRKGCSIRLAECAGLAEALAGVAAERTGGEPRRPPGPTRQRPDQGRPVSAAKPRRAEGFDEFADRNKEPHP